VWRHGRTRGSEYALRQRRHFVMSGGVLPALASTMKRSFVCASVEINERVTYKRQCTMLNGSQRMAFYGLQTVYTKWSVIVNSLASRLTSMLLTVLDYSNKCAVLQPFFERSTALAPAADR
jgi:hypothetical protein